MEGKRLSKTLANYLFSLSGTGETKLEDLCQGVLEERHLFLTSLKDNGV